MEENRTLTGTKREMVEKHIETMKRRLSYLEERVLLRGNSFDARECGAIKHCIWLLTLEFTDAIILTDAQTSRASDSRDTNTGSDKQPQRVILRRKTENDGVS